MPYSSFRLMPVMFGLFLPGCSGAFQDHAEVSGTVTYQGKPLPGGIITFTSDKGEQTSATIDENGHYTISVEIGPGNIVIDNQLLKKDLPVPEPLLNQPDEVVQSTKLIGKHIPIREAYSAKQSSSLLYTVTPGSQVKDIELR
jgi:hypothetical protein